MCIKESTYSLRKAYNAKAFVINIQAAISAGEKGAIYYISMCNSLAS